MDFRFWAIVGVSPWNGLSAREVIMVHPRAAGVRKQRVVVAGGGADKYSCPHRTIRKSSKLASFSGALQERSSESGSPAERTYHTFSMSTDPAKVASVLLIHSTTSLLVNGSCM